MKTEDLNMPEILPLWVGLTSGAEFPLALPRDEALRRGRELLEVLRKGTLSNPQIEADEDVKHVLYALCELLREPGREGQLLLEDANAVYHFIESVQWPDDVLEEKRELLLECAEIGWGAIGLSVAEITRRRLAEPLGEMDDARQQTGTLCDPKYNNARLTPLASDGGEQLRECISEPDVLMAVCLALKEIRNDNPSRALAEAEKLYAALSGVAVGLFDEREYFLGEVAFLAGGAHRQLGNREETELWLDRAEASFRHTVNPGPLLAGVSYERLALLYESRRYQRVMELLPSLVKSFETFRMEREVLKCHFLEMATLKDIGRPREARQLLEQIKGKPALREGPVLHGLVLVNLGEILASEGLHAEAAASFQEALVLRQGAGQNIPTAHLKVAVGEALREQGQLGTAIDSYRAAVADYLVLGMQTKAAYVRVLASETLIAADRPREAEWEILAALPTIEEQKMVPEGFAAVALLKESVRRRKTDPNALRELREHLQATK